MIWIIVIEDIIFLMVSNKVFVEKKNETIFFISWESKFLENFCSLRRSVCNPEMK